jgi:hypothetical protein
VAFVLRVKGSAALFEAGDRDAGRELLDVRPG